MPVDPPVPPEPALPAEPPEPLLPALPPDPLVVEVEAPLLPVELAVVDPAEPKEPPEPLDVAGPLDPVVPPAPVAAALVVDVPVLVVGLVPVKTASSKGSACAQAATNRHAASAVHQKFGHRFDVPSGLVSMPADAATQTSLLENRPIHPLARTVPQ